MPTTAPSALLIYGATGFTGQLVAEEARRLKLDFGVAGRDRAKVDALAQQLGVPGRTFALHDPITVLDNIDGARVVLNVAGPFGRTAEPLIDAAIARGIHYLDTSAEFATYAQAEERSAAAAAAGAMLVPGVGWDVVPSDAVAVHAAARTPRPVGLRIALEITGGFSRGSVSSAAGIADLAGVVRTAGHLIRGPGDATAVFDFGSGPNDFASVPMGDLITGRRSLGLDNIAVFMRSTGAIPVPGDDIPDGPTAADRLEGRYRALAEITDEDGTVVRSVIDTPNGYNYTQLAAARAAGHVLDGRHPAGFQTPSTAFGPGFATSISDSFITDL